MKHLPALSFSTATLLVLGGLCLAAPAWSQEAPKLSAEKVLANNVAARGGLAAWKKIQTMSYSGKMDAARQRPELAGTEAATAQRRMQKPRPGDKFEAPDAAKELPDIALPFRLELKRPLKSRVELDFNGSTAVQTYDGSHGWKLRPFAGKTEAEAYTPDELKDAAAQQALDGMLIDAAAKGNRIILEGSEPIEGKPAYKLKVTLKNGTVRHVWVDAASFLEVQFDGTRQFDGHPTTLYTALKDYRTVDGVTVPFVMETRVQGVKHVERIVIDKVTVNAALADERFGRPTLPAAPAASPTAPGSAGAAPATSTPAAATPTPPAGTAPAAHGG